jgi:hypothetical protein
MCLKIEPLVRELFIKRRPVFVIDQLDAPLRLTKETAALVGVLIRWLKDEERATNHAMRFLIALPTNLLRVGQSTGDIYLRGQELFAEIRWSAAELETLVADRVRAALGSRIAVEDWLMTACALRFSELHPLTFGRPRNYIQLIRNCLEVKLADPNRAASKCRDLGLQQYASQTLSWLGAEWQAANEGFDDLADLLNEFPDVVTPVQLKEGIDEIRGRGVLNKWGVNTIIAELAKWQLIKEERGQKEPQVQYRPHPIIKLAKQFNF